MSTWGGGAGSGEVCGRENRAELFWVPGHGSVGRFRCGNVGETPCFMKYGGDYGMPQTRSALLWDLPRNQLTLWKGCGGGGHLWQQNLYLLLGKGSIGSWSEVASKRNLFWGGISRITMFRQQNCHIRGNASWSTGMVGRSFTSAKCFGSLWKATCDYKRKGSPVMRSESKIDFCNEEIDFSRKWCDSMMFGWASFLVGLL